MAGTARRGLCSHEGRPEMTTEQRAEQRSRFRLPWAGSRGDADDATGPAPEPHAAEAQAPESRDGGRGQARADDDHDGWDPRPDNHAGRLGASPARTGDEPTPWGGWHGRVAGFDGDPDAPTPEEGRFRGMDVDGLPAGEPVRADAQGAQAEPVNAGRGDVEWPAEDMARLRAMAVEPPPDELDEPVEADAAAAAGGEPPIDLGRLFGSTAGPRANATAPTAATKPDKGAEPTAAAESTVAAEAAPETTEAAPDALAPAPDAAEPAPMPAAPTPAPARPSGARPAAPASTAPAVTPPPAAGLASKFMADLSRAMQAAAQAARDEALARLSAEAATRIETIGAASATGAEALRRAADDDVAATRGWAEAEIARIHEETERRITERRARLEGDLVEHAASITRRTDAVRATLAAYEAELGRFIEQVLAEEDPTRIATLAQRLPEPPVLDESPEPSTGAATAGQEAPATGATRRATTQRAGRRTTAGADDAEAAALAEARSLADAEAEAEALAAADARAGMTPDSAAAAEAEALAGLEGGDAAWFAGQAATTKGRGRGSGSVVRSELIVTGLASVAGIAGFKRELSAVDGVRHVGVSAGHAGEFVFAVGHAATLDLADTIHRLVAFGARVTGKRDGSLLVTASEPAAGE